MPSPAESSATHKTIFNRYVGFVTLDLGTNAVRCFLAMVLRPFQWHSAVVDLN
jgi:hypothetical protein